jgi:hypothetical protein
VKGTLCKRRPHFIREENTYTAKQMKKKSIRFLTMAFLMLTMNGLSFAYMQGESETKILKISYFGPGTPLYSWWGHISIIIEDTAGDNNRIIDYGIFSFNKDNFFTNFAFGRLVYSCGSFPAEPVINDYIAQNRDVTIYTLNVSAEKKREIIERIEQDLLPENREYIYHHFRDNCSTRIRDIINVITEGQFYSRFAGETSRLTLREHIRRFTWFSPFFDWFLNFLLGRESDNAVTQWDVMFLPSEVAFFIQNFEYTTSGGNSIKLVNDTQKLYTVVDRSPVPNSPPMQWPLGLFVGLFMAGTLTSCMALDIRQIKPGKTAWLLLQGLLGCFSGLAGSLLYFMSFFTNHDYTYNNLNTLAANPLLLAALPAGIIALTADNYIKEAIAVLIIKIIWTLLILGGIASVLLSAVFYQQNQMTLALILPSAFVLSLFPCWLFRFARYFFWRLLP